MRNLIFYVAFLINLPLFSQKLERITIKAGEGQRQALMRQLYHNPSFANGVVSYKNGDTVAALMNYHKGFDQIHLIAGVDTVAITNNYEIKNVRINKDTFYYDDKYILIVQSTTHFKLGKQQKIRAANKDEKGTYEHIPGPGSSAESYSAFGVNTQFGNPDGKKDFPMIRQTIFYIGDRYHRFTKITRKNLLYMFPAKQDQINKYIKKNSVTLNNEEEMKKLIVFLESIHRSR